MAIVNNYGTLKAEMTADLFHPRLAARYDSAINRFEAAANTRLRVRQMETKDFLQTDIAGNVRLPDDYLLWRSVLQDNTTTTGGTEAELNYVHPAYLKSTVQVRAPAPGIFTIEGPELIVRPIDTAAVYIMHYYGKIPTLIPVPSTGFGDATDNWLILEYPNAYIFGVLCELAGMQRNVEMAQLYKARRDEAFAEITQLSALTTGPAAAPQQRTAEYFEMPKIFDRDGNEIADFPLSEKMLAALDADEEIAMIFHTPQLYRGTLGHQAGSFTLRKIGARVVALDAGTVKKYAAIQQAVKKARGLE